MPLGDGILQKQRLGGGGRANQQDIPSSTWQPARQPRLALASPTVPTLVTKGCWLSASALGRCQGSLRMHCRTKSASSGESRPSSMGTSSSISCTTGGRKGGRMVKIPAGGQAQALPNQHGPEDALGCRLNVRVPSPTQLPAWCTLARADSILIGSILSGQHPPALPLDLLPPTPPHPLAAHKYTYFSARRIPPTCIMSCIVPPLASYGYRPVAHSSSVRPSAQMSAGKE